MASVVLRLGDDVSTDIIYPGRFMATVLPTETPQHAFADDPTFHSRLLGGQVPPGSIIIAGRNFGCGSSREQAASCLKGHELTIVAAHFARIFLQNSSNVGLRTVICASIEAHVGDLLDITPDEITNRTSGKLFHVKPLAPARQAIVDAGGLIPFTRALLQAGRP
jgi:3-isopropylmalate/(R)-2-methylmalate dehydratase small subunit